MDFSRLLTMFFGITISVVFLGFIGFVLFYLVSFGWAFVTAFFWFFNMVGYHTVLMTLFLTLLVTTLILSAVRFLRSFMG